MHEYLLYPVPLENAMKICVNSIFTFVFSRRDSILHLGDPRPAYARKILREASVKVNVSAEHLSADIQ